MCRAVFASALVVLLTNSGVQNKAGVESPELAIPKEALDAWKKYEMDFNVTHFTQNGEEIGRESKRASELEVKASGECRLVIAEKLEGSEWRGEVYGQNENYWFALRRTSRKSPWVVTYLALKARGEDPGLVADRG